MTIYDISRPITPELAVWPGDTPFSYQTVLRKQDGHSVNLTTLTLSAHTGTHADAPFHYNDNGEHPAALPLEKYIGSAQVVSLSRQSGGIVPADFAPVAVGQAPRLLIHTWCSDLQPNQWPEDFPYPTIELVKWLAEKEIVLLGVDMPSVDNFNSQTLDGHHALYQYGIVNLESLMLRDIPDGIYELIALPLKLDAVCGSPVRAVLRTI